MKVETKFIGQMIVDFFIILIPFLYYFSPLLIDVISYIIVTSLTLSIISMMFKIPEVVERIQKSELSIEFKIYDFITDLLTIIAWGYCGYYAVSLLMVLNYGFKIKLGYYDNHKDEK